jgi:peptidoglycan LD-endopeptidase LytH
MNPFADEKFHPVIQLPAQYEVYDLTSGYNPNRTLSGPFGIGKYNERRVGMYTDKELFAGDHRDIHIGIDIAAPVGTPIHAFYDGEIFLFGINSAEGDYGPTLITQHSIKGRTLYALYGHLRTSSLDRKQAGQKISKGEVIAEVGEKSENGGWNPHVHFQLSWEKPNKADMPGAVNERDLAKALATYPDPRLVLGPLY